jgi:integrase
MLADWCETAQFLAARRLVLDNTSRDLFLDALYGDFGEALKLLIRQAHGDYSPDTWPLQFPKFETAVRTGLTPWQLFERWIDARSPADATVDRWRGVFLELQKDFSGRSAASITVEEAQEWATGLVGTERTARTVRDVWVVACRTVFGEAVRFKLLARNVFTEVHLPVPRSNVTRETKAFRPEEARTILRASLAVEDTDHASNAVRRWVPWVCAYTGARSGEITQLRGVDVIKQEGIDAIRITPEAGPVKTKQARLVPLHSNLIKQGFLSFVASKGKGPLFYNPPKHPSKSGSATNPSKARSR